jgi:signal peptidase II
MKKIVANRGIAVLIAAVVAGDWMSKLWVTNRLELGHSFEVVEGWLYFVHRQNPGVAFSMFAQLSDGWRIPLLSLLTLAGIYTFGRLVASTTDTISQIAGAAVIAGAVGNLGDRLVSGAVTDFLLFPFFPFVFNVADTAITIGAVVLAIRLGGQGETATPAGAASGAA